MTTATLAEQVVTTEGFETALIEQFEKEIEVFPARAWYPSQVGHPCDRFLVWRFTRWEEQKRHDARLECIFQEGRLHQPAVYERLEKMGFEIVREHDRPVQYALANGAVISGRPDGKIRGFRGVRYNPPWVLEIKSTQDYQLQRLRTIDDVRTHSNFRMRGNFDQAQVYCLIDNLPHGILAFKGKGSGWPKILPFDLNFGYAEQILQRVETLQVMVNKKEDPPPIPYDPMICGGCPFEHLCYPPRDMGEGVHVLTDEGLLEDLDTRERTKAARDEYENADKAVKDRLKKLGVKLAVAGSWAIEAIERPVASYVVKERVDTILKIKKL